MSDAPPVTASGLEPGTRLNGTYEVDSLIAVGGMGEVYQGHLVETGDKVAIKVIRPELVGNGAALALFRKEASALHRLNHEAIIRYYVFAIDPGLGRPYLAMEFVEGEPLTSLLKRGALAPAACRTLLDRLAAGLAAAHQHGIFHRDISPDNVIVPDGDVTLAKIIDFGIAKSTMFGATTVIGDGFAGKYSYVSPEQLGLFGGEVGARSDIYSLGLLIAEAARGRALDMGRNHAETIDRRRAVPALDDIDESLCPVLRQMLQPMPDDRPATMAAVRQSLRSDTADAALDAAAATAPLRRRGRLLDMEAERRRGAARRPLVMASLAGAAALAALAYGVVTLAPGMLARQPGAVGVTGGPYEPLPPGAVVTARPGPGERPPQLTALPGLSAPATSAQEGAAAQEGPVTAEAGSAAPAGDLAALLLQTRPRTEPGSPAPAAGSSPPAPREAPVQVPLLPAAPATVPASGIAANPAAAPKPTDIASLPASAPDPRSPAGLVARFNAGNRCFFARLRASGDGKADIESFGSAVGAVQQLDETFKAEVGFEASIQFRQLTEAQCPAAEFLRKIASAPEGNLRFELQPLVVKAGQPVEGSIQNTGLRSITILSISEDGAVQITPVRAQPGGRDVAVTIPTERVAGTTRRPRLVLALIAPQRPASLERSGVMSAAQVFPALAAELDPAGGDLTILTQYFRIEG